MTTDEWGIDDSWTDTQGRRQQASPATIAAIRDAMGAPGSGRRTWVVRPDGADRLPVPCHLRLEDGSDLGELGRLPTPMPLGIHELMPADGSPSLSLLVSPGRCHLPTVLRTWGVVAQVPTTRSRQSWGIGDLGDMRTLAGWLATRGAGMLGLSPLHAPTPVSPLARSPYFASSRRWRNPLLIRVDEVPGGDASPVTALGREARALLAAPVVDRDACWAIKRLALELIWAKVGPAERTRLDDWRAAQGEPLEGWARYCALAEQHGPSWHEWPTALRHPGRPAVLEAAALRADRVTFHAWLQLLAADQLDTLRQVGPRVVQDLAIGVDPAGADAWLWQDLMAPSFSVGAPPDEFEPDGQRWGLPPWIPWRLRDVGYRPLADLLRSALLPGGGLRIDHVMGLTRLFWIPNGGDPGDGAYVRFEGTELLDLVAMESARAGAIVVGEDLGTVEPGFRDRLTDAGILSTKVVWFEHDPPEAWPEQALAMVTTHDLPTVAGLSTGVDSPAAMRARVEALVGPLSARPSAQVSVELHRRLARSPAVLAAATVEDLVGVVERPNQPGTLDGERPNWSVALPVSVEDIPTHIAAAPVLAALAESRSRLSPGPAG